MSDRFSPLTPDTIRFPPIADTDDTAQQLGANHEDGPGRWLPCWRWLRDYDVTAGRRDVIAGLLLAALLVPQAAAYAFLAGLPASAGFIAAAFAPMGYALLGTGRQISVGPVALLSLLTATAIASAEGEALQVAAQLGLLTGALLLLIGLLRVGHLTNFISEPVLTGFITAAALTIGATQVGNFLGLELERGEAFAGTLLQLAGSLGNIDATTTLLACATLGGLMGAPGIVHWLCGRLECSAGVTATLANLGQLLVLGLAVAVTFFADLSVAAVGQVDIQLALPALERFTDLQSFKRLLPDALALAIIGYVIAYGAAASLAGRRRLTIERNYEAGALGLANVTSAVMGGYPVGASLSRSALAASLNAQTALAPVLAGLLALAFGLAGVSLFEHVANAVLAALIMKAVVGMIDVPAIVRFVKYSKSDAAGVLVTLMSVLTLGIRRGIAIGALTSLATYLLRTSMPRVVIEGRQENGGPLRDSDRRDTEQLPSNIIVLRMDDDLYFGNAAHLEQQMSEAIAAHPHVDQAVLDLKPAGMVDATGTDMLRRLNDNLAAAGVTLHLAHAAKPVVRQLRHAGLMKTFENGRIFNTARDAVDALTKKD